MDELIKFKEKIKRYNLEQLLNELVSESINYESLYGKRKDLRNLSESKVFILKMYIFENYNK